MEKYSEYYSIARCRIKPDDLFNLEKAVQSGFPEESQFEVSTEFRNLKLSAKSVAELLKHDQVPDELVTLSLSCRYYGGNLMSIDKSVTIAFSTLGSHVWIEGKDEIWVAGKHQSLVRFFDSICGSGKPRLPLKPSFLRADLFVSLAIGLWFVAAYQVVSQLDLFFSSLFSVSSVYLLAKYVDWARWGTTSEAVKIVIRQKKFSFLNMEPKEIIPIVISLASLVVSIFRLF